MAEQPQGHHLHRPHRLSLPSRPTTSRLYPPFPATTPTPTPSKHRLSSTTATRYPVRTTAASSSSLSSLLLLLFSLRSLYSLLPFLRSSPSSFSLFPFSFLVSFLSFLLTLSFSLLPLRAQNPNPPSLSLSSISTAHHRNLLLKSLVLAVVFLLRFQALRYCGTAAMILAELSGNVAARFAADRSSPRLDRVKVRGFFVLFLGLLLLSICWDRIECFPLSSVNVGKLGFLNFISPQNEKCVRVWPMLLPFLAGFIGCYERVSISLGTVRELGRKRVRLVSLFYTTIVLFVPAVISMFVFEAEGDSISVVNLGWPLANTVVFGVLLSENYTDEKLANSKDFRREFIITFVCTLVLELFYYPELSLWGLLICGALLGIAVMELDPVYSRYLELGFEPSESVTASIMKSIRHILSERKSRKIALFLLINTCYMVVEFITGFMSNSLGLISDACHMLFDCAALAIGLYASYISRLPANGEYNYGRGRFEVLSGYANAVFLVLVGLFLVLESFERILEPQEISTSSLLTVSIGGLLVNVIGLIFFHDEHHHAHGGAGSCSHSHTQSHAHHDNHHHVHNHSGHDHIEVRSQKHDHHQCNHSDHDHHHDHDKHHDHAHGCNHDHDHDHHHDHEHLHDHGHHHNHVDHHDQGNLKLHGEKDVPSEREKAQKKKHLHIDHNMEGIFLHVLADTLGSLGVVVSTLLIQYKGWLVADPACSIFISALIVSSVIPLLRNSAEILLQRVPRAHEQELNEAVRDIRKTKGVRSIQKLHVWSLTNTDVVGTLQLQVDKDTDIERTKTQVSNILRDAGVKDLTLQLERMQSS